MIDFHVDLAIIGGGINGAGIARDAAGRGLSVLLVEENDLAGATSSASSKLIHGGLRYLEHFEFLMVRGALKEREILLKTAPHLVSGREFVLPHDKTQRPEWMIRAGLFLYDLMAGKKTLPSSRPIDFTVDHFGDPLRSDYRSGFVYSDCWVDDTRLVILNAVDAAERNAKIMPHTQCQTLHVESDRWILGLRNGRDGLAFKASASMVVNATGPWVSRFLEQVGFHETDSNLPRVRLVKGSHIILPKQYEGEHIYILQQPDKRIVFVIPYEGKYTLIGTTEEVFVGNPRDAVISPDEMNYLCEAYNRAFENSILPSDIIFHYSGVRPLLDDGDKSVSSNTRDYKIYRHRGFTPPMLSVFGGKLTTYRALSEKVVNTLMEITARDVSPWTAKVPLAGGDFSGFDFEAFVYFQGEQYPWLPKPVLTRYARAYGTRMDYFLYQKDSLSTLGKHYGDHVYEAEINYLINYEWASSIEDILWRRSKLGLQISEQTMANLENALAARAA